MISWVAIERITAEAMASDEKLRKEAGARPVRSSARLLTDEDLLDKLLSFGIALDRPLLELLSWDAGPRVVDHVDS
jgi:hypothetical protein